MLLLFRMDRSVYIRGLEMFDRGICILQQIHVHCYMYMFTCKYYILLQVIVPMLPAYIWNMSRTIQL